LWAGELFFKVPDYQNTYVLKPMSRRAVSSSEAHQANREGAGTNQTEILREG
jgi:hypothetical protein